MKNITRRRLSTFIAIVMVLTLSITTPLTVLAQNDSTVQNTEVANDESVVTDTASADAEAVEEAGEVELGQELLDPSTTINLNDFEYATSGSYIVLRGYTGSAIEVNIPATVTIGSDTYTVMLNDDCSGFFDGGEDGNTTTKTITFEDIDTSNVTNMSKMFYNYKALTTLDVSNLDTDNVTDMSYMFAGCSSLESLNLSNFNTGRVTKMTDMFNGCSSLTSLDLSGFNMSKTTGYTSNMLENCGALTTIKIPLYLQDTVDLPTTFVRQDDPDTSYNALPLNKATSFTIVVPVHATGVSLSTTGAAIFVGESINLTATVAPDNATDKTVDNTGKVTAVGVGGTTITAKTKDGGFTATCTVTVNSRPVTGVTVTPTTKSLNVGESYNLAATVEPATATNKNVTWSSSNPTVVSVDNTGKITALQDGSATITVRTEDGGKTATCLVTVNVPIVHVTGVTVTPTTKSLNVGETTTLTATVTPDNATDKSVTWTSSKPEVATVDANGKVTAVSEGQATITATTVDGSKTATCTVTVNDVVVPVEGVAVSPSSKTLGVGESFGLAATVTPANATNKKLTWSSNKPSVATVDSNGKVTAVSQGEAVITVITEDGNFASVCNVTVKSSRIPATGISVTPTSKTLNVADTFNISATITPANATDKRIIWNSSNPKIATVDDYGNVKALRPGHVIITASSVSGDHTAACEVTVVEKLGPTIDIYRLYNPITGEHFYTGDESEIRNMVAVGWIDEGYAWTAPASSERAVYRLYNSTSDSHHYTSDEAEKQNLLSLGWIYEKICWYSNNFGNAGVALYRLFNANASTAASHFYTSDLTERNNLMNLGWKYEGIGWYGI